MVLLALAEPEVAKFWRATVPELKEDLRMRIHEGRGVVGLVDEKLPLAIQRLDEQ